MIDARITSVSTYDPSDVRTETVRFMTADGARRNFYVGLELRNDFGTVVRRVIEVTLAEVEGAR